MRFKLNAVLNAKEERQRRLTTGVPRATVRERLAIRAMSRKERKRYAEKINLIAKGSLRDDWFKILAHWQGLEPKPENA